MSCNNKNNECYMVIDGEVTFCLVESDMDSLKIRTSSENVILYQIKTYVNSKNKEFKCVFGSDKEKEVLASYFESLRCNE